MLCCASGQDVILTTGRLSINGVNGSGKTDKYFRVKIAVVVGVLPRGSTATSGSSTDP